MTTNPTHTHTRSESVRMWQWNGLGDLPKIVKRCCRNTPIHGTVNGVVVLVGDWIIERILEDGTKTFKVISNAEKQAQGWKEIE